jgi:hypothetical protein
MQVIADLHGGDLEDVSAKAEFQEIKGRVNFDVSIFLVLWLLLDDKAFLLQRASGEARSYKVMWDRYKRRVLLAMSSQAFAQLVRACDSTPASWATNPSRSRMASMVCIHCGLFDVLSLIRRSYLSHFILCTYVWLVYMTRKVLT